MFATGISPDTQGVLEALATVDFVKQYYLAGGTACALYYGHRISYDLDFFSTQPEDSSAITSKLKGLGELKVDQASKGTWLGSLDGVKLSFFEHLYPEIDEEKEWSRVRVASKFDLGCMKLEDIASRGIMRDFVDMYYLARELGVDNIFSKAHEKYKGTGYSELHFLRSLTYFEEADNSVPPAMLVHWDWTEIKQYFVGEVKRISQDQGI